MILQEKDLVECLKGTRILHGRILSINEDTINITEVVKQKVYSIDKKDVLANYGENPDLDYLKINEYKCTKIIEGIGNCEIYRNLNDTEINEVLKLSELSSKLKDFSWAFPMNIKICVNRSKTNQSKFKFNKKNNQYEIILSPMNMVFDVLKELFISELGKIIIDHCDDKKVNAAWIKLFEKNIKHIDYSEDDVKNLRDSFVNSGMEVKEYVNNMDDGALMNRVFLFIREKHKLSAKNINTLVASGNDLQDFWPKTALSVNDMSLFVNDQSKKSVEDFFAESFRFNFFEEDLPDVIKNAITKTLKYIKKKEGIAEENKVEAEVLKD